MEYTRTDEPATERGSPPERCEPGNIPQELKDRDQWVVWKRVEVPDAPKPKKVALQGRYTGRRARTNDPSTWCSFGEALEAFEKNPTMEGIGYVFGEDDPYVGFDYDDCRNPETGEMHDIVRRELEEIGGYAEVSPSGTGAKAIVRGRKPGTRCSTKETPWGDEFAVYGERRFFALTGRVLEGHRELREAQPAIDRIYGRRFPAPEEVERATPPPTGGADGLSDEELADRACKFRNGARFRRHHFEGETTGYKSRSEADFAHMSDLYWLTGDQERTVQMFMNSALYLPSKGEGYVRRSVKSVASKHRGGFYELKCGRGVEELREKTMLGVLGVLFSEEEKDTFKGQAGGTDHDVLCAVGIGISEEGIPYKGGLLWCPGEENGAEKAGVTRPTYRAALERLAERFSWFEIVKKPRARAKGGVLIRPVEVLTTNIHTGWVSSSCKNLHGFAELLRLRWGRDLHARFQRVGKCAAAYLHWLVAFPDGLDAGVLAERTGRKRDDVIRYLRRLESNGLVEKDGSLWRLHAEFRSRLAEIIEDNAAGAESRARQRDERADEAREYWREREENGEDAQDVPVDLDAKRLFRAGWRARREDGEQLWACPGDPIEWVSRKEALRRLRAGERRPWSRSPGLGPPEEHPLDCECLGCSALAPSYAGMAGT
jgi:hypothetical protein